MVKAIPMASGFICPSVPEAPGVNPGACTVAVNRRVARPIEPRRKVQFQQMFSGSTDEALPCYVGAC